MSDRLEAAVAELVEALRAELAAGAAPPAPDRLLDIDSAAEALNLGRSKVYSEIGAGRLRSLTVGRRRLVPQSAVTAYIEERAGDARTDAA